MTATDLYQSIATFLEEAERPYQGDGANVIVTAIEGDGGNWQEVIQITETEESRNVVIHAQFPACVPEDNRLKVAELLTRINYDLVLGNFELGIEDGEILFKTAIELADGELTRRMFWKMYELNVQTMNQYFSQVLSVGFEGMALLAADDVPQGEMLQ